MHELNDQELYQAFAYARSLDENQGKQIMMQLAQDHPGFSQTLFGFLPAIIAEQNQDMAYLFMDLCFDVVCVFQYTFGNSPHGNDPVWLEQQMMSLSADLQALNGSNMADEKLRKTLQERFTRPNQGEIAQTGLLKVLYEAIDEHAALNVSRVPAIAITQSLMSVVVKLIGHFYTDPIQRSV